MPSRSHSVIDMQPLANKDDVVMDTLRNSGQHKSEANVRLVCRLCLQIASCSLIKQIPENMQYVQDCPFENV